MSDTRPFVNEDGTVLILVMPKGLAVPGRRCQRPEIRIHSDTKTLVGHRTVCSGTICTGNWKVGLIALKKRLNVQVIILKKLEMVCCLSPIACGLCITHHSRTLLHFPVVAEAAFTPHVRRCMAAFFKINADEIDPRYGCQVQYCLRNVLLRAGASHLFG